MNEVSVITNLCDSMELVIGVIPVKALHNRDNKGGFDCG